MSGSSWRCESAENRVKSVDSLQIQSVPYLGKDADIGQSLEGWRPRDDTTMSREASPSVVDDTGDEIYTKRREKKWTLEKIQTSRSLLEMTSNRDSE